MGHLRRTVAAVAILWAAACSGGSAAGGPRPGSNVRVGAPTLATQIVELERGLPNAHHGRVLEVADVNGDGAPDVLCGAQLYRNQGRGMFEPAPPGSLPPVAAVDSAAFGDVDGDGDVDLVVATPAPRLWRNDGAGRFAVDPASGPLGGTEAVRGLALGDADGDGDLDVALASATQNRLLRNDGNGTFLDATATTLPSPSASHLVAFVDVDGDGDSDLVCGAPNRLLRNTGGVFVEVWLAMPQYEARDLTVGDVDGDGDLDLVMTRAAVGENTILLRNDGNGYFTNSTGLPPGLGDDDQLAASVLGDVDGDGDLDLVTGHPPRVMRNDGAGTFVEAPVEHLGAVCGVSRARLADVDGDGDLDALFATSLTGYCVSSGAAARLHFNDGNGVFRDAQQGAGAPFARVMADFDSDLDLDFMDEANRLQLNDGFGRFVSVNAAERFEPPPNGTPMAVLDLEGDGNVDVLMLDNFGLGRVTLYRGVGAGHFQQAPFPTLNFVGGVAIGDVDRDGRLDLVFSIGHVPANGSGGPPILLLGSGGGAFVDASTTRLPPSDARFRACELGDIDADGDLDLVLTSADFPASKVWFYVNNGAGVFAEAPERRIEGGGGPIRLVDLDGDADLDLLLDGEVVNTCWENRGEEGFVNVSLRAFGDTDWGTLSMGPGDLDGDGDLDLLAYASPGGLQVLLQDAPLQFRPDASSAFESSTGSLYSLPPMNDFDGDGDLEWYQRTNLARHLHAPTLATIGRPYLLRVFSRPGWLSQAGVAQVFVGLEPNAAPVSTPAGVFRLGALALAELPALTIPASLGFATATIDIPVAPALVGLSIHSQALVSDPAGGLPLFTNALVDRIGN